MLEMALRQAVELSSYARAAENFSELTNVSISASSMQRLVLEYGTEVLKAEASEAEAMVCVAKEEEGVSYRRIPEPDSEVMAVSADGVMVHLREEGWKEAKVASVSAAPVGEAGEKAEGELRLTKHSYRAGLWDAKPLPTTTGPRVAVGAWKKPNGSSASTTAPSGFGRWSSSVFPAASKFSTGGTCCSTSGRSRLMHWVRTHQKRLPGSMRRKPLLNQICASPRACLTLLLLRP